VLDLKDSYLYHEPLHNYSWAPTGIGTVGALGLPWKSWSVIAWKKLHLRSQYERPRRCFSWRKTANDCSTPTISFLCTMKEELCVVVGLLVFPRRTSGRIFCQYIRV